jgi:deoxyribodipyrimidine photolyase-related protein
MKIFLIYPNQLFENITLISEYDKIFLIEDPLFFTQYNFHKQKLIFHRATMKMYEEFLINKNISVEYIEHHELKNSKDITKFFPKNIEKIGYYNLVDDWLETRLKKAIQNINIEIYNTPLFLLTQEDIEEYPEKETYVMNSFYIEMRKKFSILIDEKQKPFGGSWSLDKENRKKIPKGLEIPIIKNSTDTYFDEAVTYIEKYFKDNYGSTDIYMYVHTFQDTKKHFKKFLKDRFENFGIYEDAIMQDEYTLFHSVISPYLNIGLLTPQYVLETTLKYVEEYNIPLNSLEGFIRQVLGWREFMRLMYVKKGKKMRTSNFLNHTKKIPANFWSANTNIDPIDKTISKVLKTAYCHHIERLMILSNFMLLSGYDPNEVYKWFMELFIDAYDWVMVPNVYGMGQYADGGIFATKPYISGSNYILKMSDYAKGDWSKEWDALYWNFIEKHADKFAKNPRMSLIVSLMNKRKENKLK